MKKIFLFSALALLFVFFSCQKENPIDSEFSTKKGEIKTRKSLSIEEFSTNHSFIGLMNNYSNMFNQIKATEISDEDKKVLLEINQLEFPSENADMESVSEILQINTNHLINTDAVISNYYSSLFNAYPILREMSKSELENLFQEAVSFSAENQVGFFSPTPQGDGMVGSGVEVPPCTINFTKFNLDGSEISCPDLTCVRAATICINEATTQFIANVNTCFQQGAAIALSSGAFIFAAISGLSAGVAAPGGLVAGISLGFALAFGLIPLIISQIAPLSTNNIWRLLIISALIINYGVFKIDKIGGIFLSICLMLYACSIFSALSNLPN